MSARDRDISDKVSCGCNLWLNVRSCGLDKDGCRQYGRLQSYCDSVLFDIREDTGGLHPPQSFKNGFVRYHCGNLVLSRRDVCDDGLDALEERRLRARRAGSEDIVQVLQSRGQTRHLDGDRLYLPGRMANCPDEAEQRVCKRGARGGDPCDAR